MMKDKLKDFSSWFLYALAIVALCALGIGQCSYDMEQCKRESGLRWFYCINSGGD